jgi:hypothetical protein
MVLVRKKYSGSAPAEKLRIPRTLLETAQIAPGAVLSQHGTQTSGLTDDEASRRLEERGYNDVAQEQHLTVWKRLWDIVLISYIRDPVLVGNFRVRFSQKK